MQGTKKYKDEGLILKQLRINGPKLSQVQFARSVGVYEQTIENLEQGNTSCNNLRYHTLKKIANGLLETPESLIDKITKRSTANENHD